jgi:hypothetical protein
MAGNPMSGWRVYILKRFRCGKVVRQWLDTVFFTPGMTATEVKDSLVNHDGFHPAIVVRLER